MPRPYGLQLCHVEAMIFGKFASVGTLVMVQVSVSGCLLSASAQLPPLQNFSSRDLTDAVTQGVP